MSVTKAVLISCDDCGATVSGATVMEATLHAEAAGWRTRVRFLEQNDDGTTPIPVAVRHDACFDCWQVRQRRSSE